MACCLLCQPMLILDDQELALHMRVEHDIDLSEDIETWPDGRTVFFDEDIQPHEFED